MSPYGMHYVTIWNAMLCRRCHATESTNANFSKQCRHHFQNIADATFRNLCRHISTDIYDKIRGNAMIARSIPDKLEARFMLV
jgi:ribosomal protein L40E